VTVLVTEPLGVKASAHRSVAIDAELGAPVLQGPSTAATGATLSFSAVAVGGSAPYSFRWSFGDGATGTGPSMVHAYSSSGTYRVTVTVTDAAGETANASFPIVVSAPSSWVLPAVAGAGIVLAAVIALGVWRRRRPGAPAGPSLRDTPPG
jgi:PKD repeat protein